MMIPDSEAWPLEYKISYSFFFSIDVLFYGGIALCLGIVKACIFSVKPHQFLMAALFNDSALVHDQNPVGQPHT